MHLDRNVGRERDRLFQPVLADEAPRTDHVGDDIDADGLVMIGHGRAPFGANLCLRLFRGNHLADAHHPPH